MILSIPESLYRPLGVIFAIVFFLLIRMYLRGDFTEDKLIEKVMQHTDTEFNAKKVK
jgi:hypothetical protein